MDKDQRSPFKPRWTRAPAQGSVNDAIALGRRWRNLGVLTTVGASVQTNTTQGAPANIAPMAYCEPMCVFLLLSGKTRYVPGNSLLA